MSRFAPLIAGLALALPNAGCCTLSRYFCGADETAWVPVSFTSPEATLATFREAFRKDDAIRLSGCLSEGLKARWGIGGALEVRVIKDRIAEEVPGSHMLGYAETVERRSLASDHVRYVIEIAGRRASLDLVRQPYWEVRRFDPSEPFEAPLVDSAWLTGGRAERLIRVRPEPDGSALSIQLPATMFEDLSADEVQHAAVGFEWKIDSFAVVPDTD